MLSLVKFPDVRAAIPAGGFVGTLLANALSAGFNKGAYLVAGAVLITAMFLTTSFSFSGTHAWASGPRDNRSCWKVRYSAEGASKSGRLAASREQNACVAGSRRIVLKP